MIDRDEEDGKNTPLEISGSCGGPARSRYMRREISAEKMLDRRAKRTVSGKQGAGDQAIRSGD